MTEAKINEIKSLAQRLRLHALRMTSTANSSHIGSCFSMAEILAVLYGDVLNLNPAQPDWPERDRCIISKGHAAAIVYATLAERGFFSKSLLASYGQDGSPLAGHVTRQNVPGIEVSTGSLGHGLPIAAGMALACKQENKKNRVFTILSDGEMNEGSNWETILFAAHHKLDNLTVIVDKNKLQGFGRTEDTINLGNLGEKFSTFGWHSIIIDGHNIKDLLAAFSAKNPGKPKAIVADTVKGKGISHMENKLEWHYFSVKKDQLEQACDELKKK